VFAMSAFWKGSEVSVAEVFHILVDCRRGCVIAIDRHLFEQREKLFQISLRMTSEDVHISASVRQAKHSPVS
jgi:hypothetical protein